MPDYAMNDLVDDYLDVADWVMTEGDPVEVRGTLTREMRHVSLTFAPDVMQDNRLLPIGIGRGVNLKLAAVEALQLIAGDGRSKLILRAAPQYQAVLTDTSAIGFYETAYGPRVTQSLEPVARQ
jgi:hypothetical protein